MNIVAVCRRKLSFCSRLFCESNLAFVPDVPVCSNSISERIVVTMHGMTCGIPPCAMKPWYFFFVQVEVAKKFMIAARIYLFDVSAFGASRISPAFCSLQNFLKRFARLTNLLNLLKGPSNIQQWSLPWRTAFYLRQFSGSPLIVRHCKKSLVVTLHGFVVWGMLGCLWHQLIMSITSPGDLKSEPASIWSFWSVLPLFLVGANGLLYISLSRRRCHPYSVWRCFLNSIFELWTYSVRTHYALCISLYGQCSLCLRLF